MIAALHELPVTVMGGDGYGVAATYLVEETQPDVVFISMAGPRDRALRTVAALQANDQVGRVIVYAVAEDRDLVRELVAAGVREWLPGRPTVAGLRQALFADEAPRSDGRKSGGAPRDDSRGRVITVFGAKGGIGKTTVATNLGALLAAEASVSVLLIDMDTRFGDVGLMLDIEPRYSVVQIANEIEQLTRTQFKAAVAEHSSGLDVLPAPTSIEDWGSVSARQMHDLINFAARLYDVVLLDTPGIFNDLVDMSVSTADEIVVMCTPESTCLRSTVRVLEALERAQMDEEMLFLTLNQVSEHAFIDRSNFGQMLRHPVAIEIPHEPRIAATAALGNPLVTRHPRCEASRELRELARQLTGLPLPHPQGWFWRTILGWRNRGDAWDQDLPRSA